MQTVVDRLERELGTRVLGLDGHRADLADGRTIFVKWSTAWPAGSVRAERDSLAWLAEPRAIAVGDVVACIDDDEEPLRALALDWIDAGPADAATDDRLGRELARLHRAGAATFGFPRDGFLATLPLDNTPSGNWAEFYVTRRLEPMLRRAVDSAQLPRATVTRFGRLFDRVDRLVGDPEPPARLHGDLWSGNVLVDRARTAPVLIDAAAYGGHREVDLAMLALFGGLSSRTLAAYDDEHPLADGYADRVALYQIFPLLVHVILFGSGYVERLEAAVARYS